MIRTASGRFGASIIGVAILTVFSMTASAAPVVIEMEGVGFADGDPEPLPVSLTLTIDSVHPDEDPAAGDYLATGHGNLVVDVILPPSSPLQLGAVPEFIVTDFAAGTWQMDVELIIASLPVIPMRVTFAGAGLSPDQILPDFDTVTSGTFTAESSLFVGGTLAGTMSIVPEPSTAWLVGIGLAMLGRRHRR